MCVVCCVCICVVFPTCGGLLVVLSTFLLYLCFNFALLNTVPFLPSLQLFYIRELPAIKNVPGVALLGKFSEQIQAYISHSLAEFSKLQDNRSKLKKYDW